MEAVSLLGADTLVFSALCLGLIILYWIKKPLQDSLPPGSLGWPGIGETISFLRTAPSGEFYNKREQLYGPVFKTHLLGLPTVYVSGPERLRRLVLEENLNLESCWPPGMRQLLGPGSLAASPPSSHRGRKRLFMQAMRRADLTQMARKLGPLMASELTTWPQQRPLEVYSQARVLTLRCACKALLGLQLSEPEISTVARHLHDFEAGCFSVPLNIPGSTFHRVSGHFHLIYTLPCNVYPLQGLAAKRSLKALLEEKLQEVPADGILSAIAESPEFRQSHLLSDAAVEFLFGSQETLSCFVACSVLLLTKYPEVVSKMIESLDDCDLEDFSEVNYLDRVAKEILRIHPPTTGGFRRTTKPVQIDNYVVPAGWGVTYSVRSTHRQSPYFSSDALDPDRWMTTFAGSLPQFHYIPFGAGVHSCVGKYYSLVFCRMFLTSLVKHLSWSLATPEPQFHIVPVVKPVGGLWVNFQERPPLS